MRNRGKLALALMLILAFGAALASTAVAKYDFEKSAITLEGVNENNQSFESKFGEVTCNKVTYKGLQEGTTLAANLFTANHLKVHPAYTECHAFGFNASVDTTGCNYTFTPPTSTDTTGPHAVLDIVPVSGDTCTIKINVAGGLCNTTIPNQTNTGLLDFMNLGSDTSRDITIDSTADSVDYSGTSLCQGSGSDGILSGAMTLQAFSGDTQLGLWVTNT